ncbi:MAG: extracellular solute-binding protein [Gemmataceae bacterium]|jgi:molybdenum ABC transporter molybdate-binding protein|nr:extracellular solute-binding protein [Gemmataceae bacterium]
MKRNLPYLLFGASLAVFLGIGLVYLANKSSQNELNDNPPPVEEGLFVLCAPALEPVIEKAASEFSKETGIQIRIKYDASEVALQQLKLTGKGDVFIPADESYIKQARSEGYVEQSIPLANMTAVLAVRPNYPKPADQLTWKEVLGKDFRLVTSSTQATAIGKLTKQGLQEIEQWDAFMAKNPVELGTVKEVLMSIKTGAADGGILWDALLHGHSDIGKVALPELAHIKAQVEAGVCSKSNQRSEARWFIEFLAKPEGGGKFFKQLGYNPPAPPTPGESVGPPDGEIILYAGSMLRPALEPIIEEFCKEEKVTVRRIYNGCGILVSQMRSGARPDLYVSCDTRFMGEVQDFFEKSVNVSNNQLVIVVQKGNPHDIKSLKDLGKEGLRVGVGHEQQCALGAISKETFIKSGTYAAVRRNVVVESPTGDLLVNKMLAGSLDAVVAYRTNWLPNTDKLDAIPVTGIPCAAPIQPAAVGKGARNAALSQKLLEKIRSETSKRIFLENGFGWEEKP